jgi:hypothetical protein
LNPWTAALLLLAADAGAQAVSDAIVFNHSGRLLDEADNAVDGAVRLTFKFYASKDPEDTTSVWSESYDLTAFKGMYAVELGKTFGNKQAIAATLFPPGEERWLGITVGTGAELSPRLRMGSVPYALHALDADTLGGALPSSFAAAGHTHTAAGVTDFSAAALAAAETSTKYALAAHMHPTTDVTGFTASALTAAEASTKFAEASHDHVAADVTDFADEVAPALAGKTVPGNLAVAGTVVANGAAGTSLFEAKQAGDAGWRTAVFPDGIAFGSGNGLSDVSITRTGADKLAILDGNVGIGTASPLARLHLNGGSYDLILSASDTHYSQGAYTQLSGLTDRGGLQLRYGSTDSNHPAGFVTGGAAGNSIAISSNSFYNYGQGKWQTPESATAPTWAVRIQGCGSACAADKFEILRAPATTGTPAMEALMTIDPAGRRTTPKQPGFLEYIGSISGARFLSGSDYIDRYSSNYNIGSAWNRSTGTFTVPVTGRYLINIHIMGDSGAGTMDLRIYRGGTHFARTYNDIGSGYKLGTIDGVWLLTAGEAIKLNNQSGSAIYSDDSWFSINLLD